MGVRLVNVHRTEMKALNYDCPLASYTPPPNILDIHRNSIPCNAYLGIFFLYIFTALNLNFFIFIFNLFCCISVCVTKNLKS